MLIPGVRVVRGPNWSWGKEDGGEGFTGTVCKIGNAGAVNCPDKMVLVQWDNGLRKNYRVGYNSKFDLRVIDNAQVGVKHGNIVCGGCRCPDIAGVRYKCSICFDYDLCYICYHTDKHDTSHSFKRFDFTQSIGVDLPLRENGRKCELKGIFVKSKVVRGFGWEGNNQDGGKGNVGEVMGIHHRDGNGRSVVDVRWMSGISHMYRVGHKGFCDVKFSEPTSGGYYYPEHLPILGQTTEPVPVGHADGPSRFSVGDKVEVKVGVEQLERDQQGHGEFNPFMAKYIGKIGTVHKIAYQGDIVVQYEDGNNRRQQWTFNPVTLHKVNDLAVGDIVKVVSDVEKVKASQKGKWINMRKNALGKVGKVVKVNDDINLQVQVDEHTWTLTPQCVMLVSRSAAELTNTMHTTQNQRQEPANTVHPANSSNDQTNGIGDQLVIAAAQGHLDTVKLLLDELSPRIVDVRSGGKTSLQVAAHRGHVDIIRELLQKGADVNACDNDGDTCLHYAALGNQPEVLQLLIQAGALLNTVNRYGYTALHISVQILVNAQDPNYFGACGGATFHEATGIDNFQVIDLLCSVPGIDFTIKNKQGFNVLHYAAFTGNNLATKKLLSKAPQLVNVKNGDGFSALHLAAFNGNKDVVKTLIQIGQADIDLRNNQNQTALVLAVNQGHSDVIELLHDLNGNNSTERRRHLKTLKPIADNNQAILNNGGLENLTERMRYLESKIAEIEENNVCSICIEEKKNVVFLCGHGTCSKCADNLNTCPMCRKRISKKIPIY